MPQVVLTAAHCVVNEQSGAIEPPDNVWVGSSDLRRWDLGQGFSVVKTLVHPRYRGVINMGNPDVSGPSAAEAS